MSAAFEVSPFSALSYASFGAEQATFGAGFRGTSVVGSPRWLDLGRKESYFACTQHDAKRYDFSGRIMSTNRDAVTQPLLGGSPGFYVPLRMRRPSSPVRLARVIVASFTSLLFGDQKFPNIRVVEDTSTQDWLQTLSRTGGLPQKMIRARNIGGSTGTAAISWCVYRGQPRYEVHNPRNLFVHSWEDREAFVPKHATEILMSPKDEFDPQKKVTVRSWYWHRRDWTPNWDIVFRPVLWRRSEEPRWEPDMETSVNHQDGLNHLTWIQNLPSDDVDGEADYDGQYDQLDTLDVVASIVARGAELNLDPTLKLKMDPDLLKYQGVKKGSENALVVGKDGDAEYMELAGTSLEAGLKVMEAMRRGILEAAQCVVADPNEVAAQGTSSVAMKMMYAPMLAKGDVLAEQYGAGIKRLLEGPLAVARAKSRSVVYDDLGNPEEVLEAIALPPRFEKEPVLDEAGQPTGEEKYARVERVPGLGENVDLVWPPRFPATADDQAKVAQTMTVATGGKAFLSQQTAVEQTAAAFGVDPGEEWKRVQAQKQDDRAEQGSMFGDQSGTTGGRVSAEDELPPGAFGRGPREPQDEPAGGEAPEGPDEAEEA